MPTAALMYRFLANLTVQARRVDKRSLYGSQADCLLMMYASKYQIVKKTGEKVWKQREANNASVNLSSGT